MTREITFATLRSGSASTTPLTEIQKDALTALGFYLLSRLVMLGGVVFSLLPRIKWSLLPYEAIIWSQVHDDSGWYHFITAKGYIAQDTPFFPLYPMLIRAVHALAGLGITSAGLIVSNAAFVIALFLLLRLFRRVTNPSAARWGVALFALYPMAIFDSSMYTESLFVALIAGTWLALVDRRWWLAGMLGFFAVLTRNEGGLLLIPFLFAIWQEKKKSGILSKSALFSASLLPLAGMLYAGYLWFHFGHPFLFSSMEHLWGRQFLFPLVTLGNGLFTFPHLYAINSTYGKIYYSIEIASILFALILLPLVYQCFTKDWFVFTLFMILIPLSDPAYGIISITPIPHYVQDWFFSFSRFVIPMIPLFGALGVWVSRQRYKWWVPTVFAIGLVFVSAMINDHYFLA